MDHSIAPQDLKSLEAAESIEIRNDTFSLATTKALASQIDWNRLHTLSLYGKLGPRGVVPLAQAWTTTLQHLVLSQAKLGHFGVQTLGSLLPASLQTLNLSESDIGQEGAWKLASALGELPLVELRLSKNGMGDEGCQEIVAHLPQSLRILDLSNNKIGDLGAQALAEALGSLEEVLLHHNEIGDDGATALMNALDECRSVHRLDLSENPDITESRLHVLSVILKHRGKRNETKIDVLEETDHSSSHHSETISAVMRSLLEMDVIAFRREVEQLNDPVVLQELEVKLQVLQRVVSNRGNVLGLNTE